MTNTILVTGSAGFIGYHTSKILLERGDKVIGLDNFNSHNYESSLKEDRNKILNKYDGYKLYQGDLENLAFIKAIFKENKFDKVCHLAALAGVRHSITHPHLYISSNIVGFNNIIEETKNAGVKNFIYASSSSVYGNNKKLPSSENDSVDNPISLYAATKKSNELVAYTYHHLFGLNCTGLRFFTVYGPWGRPDMALFLFTKSILENKPIDVYNYGKMQRDFTYVDDIVSGLVAALDANLSCEIFNLGCGKTEELTNFVKEIEKATKKEARLNLLPIQAGEVDKSQADIEKAKKLLNYSPKTLISIGIPKFTTWYREYYKC